MYILSPGASESTYSRILYSRMHLVLPSNFEYVSLLYIVCVCVCACACVYILFLILYPDVCVYVCMCLCCVHICVYIYIDVDTICMIIYIYIYIYTPKHTYPHTCVRTYTDVFYVHKYVCGFGCRCCASSYASPFIRAAAINAPSIQISPFNANQPIQCKLAPSMKGQSAPSYVLPQAIPLQRKSAPSMQNSPFNANQPLQ